MSILETCAVVYVSMSILFKAYDVFYAERRHLISLKYTNLNQERDEKQHRDSIRQTEQMNKALAKMSVAQQKAFNIDNRK